MSKGVSWETLEEILGRDKMEDHMWDEEKAKKLEQLEELVVKIRAACKTNTKEYEKKIDRLKIELKNTEDIKVQCDKDAIRLQEEIEQLKELVKQAYVEGWNDWDEDGMTGEGAWEGSLINRKLKER